jgi:hypothetical protein
MNGVWRKITKKLAKNMDVKKDQKVKLIVAKPKFIVVKATIVNNVIVLYDSEVYYRKTGKILLGKLIPESALLRLCYCLFRQAEIENIDPTDSANEIKLFGILISISNRFGNYYDYMPSVLNNKEKTVMTKWT